MSAPLRAWRVIDAENYVWFYEATTRGKARAAHMREIGLDWQEVMECRVLRAAALDGLPLTQYYGLAFGYITFSEDGCAGCNAAFHTEKRGNQMFIGSYDDMPAFLDGVEGEIWCSRECWEKFYDRWRAGHAGYPTRV